MPIQGRAAPKSRTSPGQLVINGLSAQEPNKPKPARSEPEFIEQKTLFHHLAQWEEKYPVLHFVHAIPNGLALTPKTARKAIDQGVKAGVWDVFLPMQRHGFPGLYVEMKAGKNKLTVPQEAFAAHLVAEGYARRVCYTWTAAAREIVDYLGIHDERIERVIAINTRG